MLFLTSLSVHGWPPGLATGGQILFFKHELKSPNLALDIFEGISWDALYIYTWLALRISLQRPPGKLKLASIMSNII